MSNRSLSKADGDLGETWYKNNKKKRGPSSRGQVCADPFRCCKLNEIHRVTGVNIKFIFGYCPRTCTCLWWEWWERVPVQRVCYPKGINRQTQQRYLATHPE